jgi:hypothetical protein
MQMLELIGRWTSLEQSLIFTNPPIVSREVLELYPTSLKTKDLAEGDGFVLLDGRRINLRPERPPKVLAVERAFLPASSKIRVRDICRFPSACKTLSETPTSPQTNNFVHLCII